MNSHPVRAVPSLALSSPTEIRSLVISLEDVCMSINNKILNQLGLFSPERDRNDVIDRDVLQEKQYDVDALQVYVETQKRLLTNDQRLAYDLRSYNT
ncbi:hypothetical protein Zmor_014426 [Zophobas morio]|uniref:Uncharacterized protein n=1 Tax=Zophobas morio TaxID=2755281 RepID=A0AA38IHF1_9CUCU|nr:hypothetical protein Zmor_014426 [Zophobas morio]